MEFQSIRCQLPGTMVPSIQRPAHLLHHYCRGWNKLSFYNTTITEIQRYAVHTFGSGYQWLLAESAPGLCCAVQSALQYSTYESICVDLVGVNVLEASKPLTFPRNRFPGDCCHFIVPPTNCAKFYTFYLRLVRVYLHLASRASVHTVQPSPLTSAETMFI